MRDAGNIRKKPVIKDAASDRGDLDEGEGMDLGPDQGTNKPLDKSATESDDDMEPVR